MKVMKKTLSRSSCFFSMLLCIGFTALSSQMKKPTSFIEAFYASSGPLTNKALVRDAIRYALTYFDTPNLLEGILVSFNQQLPTQAQSKRTLEKQLDTLLKEHGDPKQLNTMLMQISNETKDILHKAHRRDIVRGALWLLNQSISRDQLISFLEEINQKIPKLGQVKRTQEQRFDSNLLSKTQSKM